MRGKRVPFVIDRTSRAARPPRAGRRSLSQARISGEAMGTLRTYFDCIARTGRALGRTPWTLLLPAAYGAIIVPSRALAASMGILGGFVYALVLDALLASWLYVVSELVSGSKLRLRELPRSIGHYFWPIMNFFFVIWIAGFLVRPALATLPNAEAVMIGIWAVLFILLNAVPEVIYRRGTFGGLAAIGESIRFIHEHWLVWLPPNLVLGALTGLTFAAPILQAWPFGDILGPALAGALAHASLVFRGFLFQALDGTTARQRALRQRLGR